MRVHTCTHVCRRLDLVGLGVGCKWLHVGMCACIHVYAHASVRVQECEQACAVQMSLAGVVWGSGWSRVWVFGLG